MKYTLHLEESNSALFFVACFTCTFVPGSLETAKKRTHTTDAS
jgi:hypothetical protein